MRPAGKLGVSGALAGLACGLFGGGGRDGARAAADAVVPCGGKARIRQLRGRDLPAVRPLGGVFLLRTGLDFGQALPYLAGGLVGGLAGGKLFPRVPGQWLRRVFALFLLYGGVRYLL